MVRIGKGNKVHIKCPICIRPAVIDRATILHSYMIYECVYCDIKFKVPRDWREHIPTRR